MAKVRKKMKRKAIIRYSIDPDVRRKFIKKILLLRGRGKTYDYIADIMNDSGFRNRDGGKLNKGFITNMFNRVIGDYK